MIEDFQSNCSEPEKQNCVEELMSLVFKVVESEIPEKTVGIAFSGGVDSSLLAKTCVKLGKKVVLLTVGLHGSGDLKHSLYAGERLNLETLTYEFDLKQIEKAIREVICLIKFKKLADLEVGILLNFVFSFARENCLRTVAIASGIDELYCGYHVFKKNFLKGEKEIKKIMDEVLTHTVENEREYEKIALRKNIEKRTPFLRKEFVDFSLKVPLNHKIKSEKDDVRKHIIRELALKLGVPREIAYRRKKALQYSSGIHKALEKIARGKGITAAYARERGYSGVREAYIKALLEKLGRK